MLTGLSSLVVTEFFFGESQPESDGFIRTDNDLDVKYDYLHFALGPSSESRTPNCKRLVSET